MELLTDERILHFRDTHVGTPTARYPLKDADWINFARVVELHLFAKLDAKVESALKLQADRIAELTTVAMEALGELEHLAKARDSDYARPDETTIALLRAALAKTA